MGAETTKSRLAGFFQTEYGRMAGYVRARLGSLAALSPEDIVQDVALALLTRPETSGPIENLSAYIYRALANRIVDERRKRRLASLEDTPGGKDGHTLADLLADGRPDALEEAELGRFRAQIVMALDQLRPEERAVIIETELKSRSFAELAEAWSTPIGTLLARKSRGLAKARALLTQQGPPTPKQGG